MLTFACQLPRVNRNLIESEGFDAFGVGIATNARSGGDFSLETRSSLMHVPARWLTARNLRYDSNTMFMRTTEAMWNLDGQRLREVQPFASINVLDLPCMNNLDSLDWVELEPALREVFDVLGVSNINTTFGHFAPPLHGADRRSEFISETDVMRCFTHFSLEQNAGDSILAVLPQKSFELYAKIERVADLHLGLQVVRAVGEKVSKLRAHDRTSAQYIANVGLKFNLKGKGVNHDVEDIGLANIIARDAGVDNTIIIGADVAHSTASASAGCPTIAAVVGSIDAAFTKYPGSMRLQSKAQEIITDLADMTKERFIDWTIARNCRLPTSILFHRDGVSESQYRQVREHEIPQIQTGFDAAHAYLSLQNGLNQVQQSKPDFKLTFIVVGKRHHVRFFADNIHDTFRSGLSSVQNARAARGDTEKATLEKELGSTIVPAGNRQGPAKFLRENGNILPGFVVDTDITHPYSLDFYLQSHKPLQGTGRPAHYFVLTNHMNLDSDELQGITHALCYVYARATRGVSYCSPAYYADRLCDRGRAWTTALPGGHSGYLDH
ncbi:hypothetical protein LTR95_014820 [Oleoguttula sp. CCFEE 5521]